MTTFRLCVILALSCVLLSACADAAIPGLDGTEPAAIASPLAAPAPPTAPPAATPAPVPPTTAPRPSPDDLASVAFSGPLVITEGGTYTGNWESRDPGVAAVTVSTTEPVVIAGSNLRGAGHLVEHGVDGVDLTVRDSRVVGLNPGTDGARVGRFVNLRNARNVLIEGNEITSTRGISLEGYAGSRSGNDTYRVIGNRARNIDGRISNGSGFYADDAQTDYAQFVQLNAVQDVPGIEIAWNEVVNEPGESRAEDVVSVYLSSGTAASPIRITSNFIDGAYPLSPESEDYSGGGIMLGDGVGRVAHVVAAGNHVLDTTNYGMAISAGSDMTIAGNRVLSDGLLPDGTPVAAQNVGIYVWDLHGQGMSGTQVTGNVVGWMVPGGSNDWWMPDADAESGNQHVDVTAELLDAEYALWQAEVDAAGVTVGPR